MGDLKIDSRNGMNVLQNALRYLRVFEAARPGFTDDIVAVLDARIRDARLTERERKAIDGHYALANNSEKSLTTLAEEMAMHEERVRQIIRSALTKILPSPPDPVRQHNQDD